ncbi:hypothetical protein TcWFU_006663 [Taenia crassiceps]|uniref:Uncharacterized protein n=1 Tax=Taenia crassiceps TaxID=6207 RepID=A0ABR4QS23_9CEST
MRHQARPLNSTAPRLTPLGLKQPAEGARRHHCHRLCSHVATGNYACLPVPGMAAEGSSQKAEGRPPQRSFVCGWRRFFFTFRPNYPFRGIWTRSGMKDQYHPHIN